MTLQASSISGKYPITIALAGQPNTGKSTVFNQLTGAKQHVGNWPGKTIEQKTGFYTYQGVTFHVVDLPGTYSLTANSLEETISRNYILEKKPNIVVVMVDAAQLERTMYLLSEVLPLPSPVVVALNMMDIAEKEGRSIDARMLEKRIGVPVVPMIAAKKQGVPELIETIYRFLNKEHDYIPNVPGIEENEKQVLAQIESLIASHIPASYPKEWAALKLLEGDTAMIALMQENLPIDQWRQLESQLGKNGDGALAIASARYEWIQNVVSDAVKHTSQDSANIRRGKFDKIATHPIWGVPVAMVIMLVAFMLSMILAIPLMLGFTSGLPAIIEWVRQITAGAPAWITAMLADGLLPGIGMALGYLGFLVGVFMAIGFVEDVGYMARVAFVADRFMSKIGLHGKSFLPMFTSLGCNISGVLGSRVVDSWSQRMMTLVMAPIVPCMAVWSVVGFFGALFFGAGAPLVTIALLVVLVIWLAFTGFLLKHTIIKSPPEGMIMELPPYHKPNWKTILRFAWMHTKTFIERGVTLVAGASLVIWALSYLPNGEIETSILASFGKFLEPLGNLIGLNWRLVVALIASMASKETALATLGVLYGLSGGVSGTSLTGLILNAEAIEQTAIAASLKSAISPASALAFTFAAFFSVPCLGTIGAILSETKSWKWTLGATSYYTFAALLAGFLAYRVGLLIF